MLLFAGMKRKCAHLRAVETKIGLRRCYVLPVFRQDGSGGGRNGTHCLLGGRFSREKGDVSSDVMAEHDGRFEGCLFGSETLCSAGFALSLIRI